MTRVRFSVRRLMSVVAIVGVPLAIFRQALHHGGAWEWRQALQAALILGLAILPFLPLMLCVRLMTNPSERLAASRILKVAIVFVEAIVLVVLS